MNDFLVGLFAVLVGALFCFRGFMTMRIVIPIWGAFAGFFLGAGIAESFTGEGFLGSVVDWIVGVAVAFVFALIAYLYYEVSVVLAMGAIGFSIGTSVMVALGVDWSWLIILAGVALGVLLAIGAIIGDLPAFLLVFLTALGGASTIVFGVMTWTNTLSVDDIDSADVTTALDVDWWWYAMYGALAVAGMIAQFTQIDRLSASMRESWSEAGGRELRTGS